MDGIVAAGHPVSAEAGAAVLREGGNAVDAAIAACLASWTAEPLLTGPGAGGYLMVAGGGWEPALLDFFVAAPSAGERAPLTPVVVSFGDATQVFHVGAASVGVPGTPSGLEEAARRWGSLPLADLAAGAAALARAGVPLNEAQAYVSEILEGILLSTPEAAAAFTRDGRALRAGEAFRSDELAETIERFGRDGAAPFVRGDLADAIVACVADGGGTLSGSDLAGYDAVVRAPATVRYRDRRVLTNPPPSAGGTLLALALAHLDASGPPTPSALVDAMARAQGARTPEFDAGLAEPGFLERFLRAQLGSTTHVSVIDADGRACAVTCTNGEGSGLVVPGTGIHLNNVMGEEDLNPLGFFTAPPGRRMPSMMAPTVVLGEDGDVELVLGSAGSNRIRSAILQVIVGVTDHGLDARAAVEAPRLHLEGSTVYAEPGIDLSSLAARGLALAPFRARNLFFGGAQAVERDRAGGALNGAGDPRRGGAAARA
ncbi:MAG TPA: gamma-glutamyltransferase [Baekduia sp.]|uniref:gamma-glutamyltransferase n=1 Tax=Baekduia sp. TaxID=2600305 RepID=UPI002D778166|nr:gamma-glutamyltransferase [Baekduia sp.]HET6506640.1 gamma-glutamyltransferase [Baekduia sp.]